MREPDLPSVTIHYAQSLDGRIATRAGQSQWISGEGTLVYAHRLRAEHDAVLVGVGTILVDDPRLTVRRCDGPSPRRVVLDSRLRIPTGAAVLAEESAADTTVITTANAQPGAITAIQGRGARVEVVEADPAGQVCLIAALRRLGETGVRSILVEGGSQIITSFLRARLVRRLSICIAPIVLGEGISAVGDLGIPTLDAAYRCRSSRWIQIGADVVFEGEL